MHSSGSLQVKRQEQSIQRTGALHREIALELSGKMGYGERPFVRSSPFSFREPASLSCHEPGQWCLPRRGKELFVRSFFGLKGIQP